VVTGDSPVRRTRLGGGAYENAFVQRRRDMESSPAPCGDRHARMVPLLVWFAKAHSSQENCEFTRSENAAGSRGAGSRPGAKVGASIRARAASAKNEQSRFSAHDKPTKCHPERSRGPCVSYTRSRQARDEGHIGSRSETQGPSLGMTGYFIYSKSRQFAPTPISTSKGTVRG